MNKCRFLKELHSYLDNQLSPERKDKIEKHLKGCPLCLEELRKLKLLSEQLAQWLAPQVSADFESAVRNKIVARELERGEKKMKAKTIRILIPSGVIAGILVFLFVGQTVVKQGMQYRLKGIVDYKGDRTEHPINMLRGGYVPGYQNLVDGVEGKARLERERAPYYQTYKYAVMAGSSKGLDGREPMVAQTWGASARSAAYVEYNQQIASPVTAEGPVIVIQPSLPATGLGDKIIRTAEIKLEVEDGKAAYAQASGICQELGGYLASSNFYKDEEGREAGSITMRIPKDKFLLALDKLNALGRVETSSTDSQDVSQEYANLQSRYDAAMVVYKKMLEALQKRQVTIPEAMRLESELTPVLRRVEDFKNQLEALNNAVSLTTIKVYFHEPAVSQKVLEESQRYIKESILLAKINAIKKFAQAIPFLGLSLIIVVAAIAAIFLLYFVLTFLFKKK